MVAKNDIGHPDNWPDHPTDDDIVRRLKRYKGMYYETTECYNGLRDEAANVILRLQKELEVYRIRWQQKHTKVRTTKEKE